MSATSSNTAVLRRMYEDVMNKGKFDLLNELVASDCVDRNPMPGQKPGRDGIRETLQMWRVAFPDIHMTVEQVFGEGDKVCGCFRVSGTHKGALIGLSPTNRASTSSGIDVCTVRDGRIVEWRHNEDLFGTLAQLGVVDPQRIFGVPMTPTTAGQQQPAQARAQPRR